MSFVDRLIATGPLADRTDKMALYGWLVGDWTMEATIFAAGQEHRAQGRVHAGWVLEGRAIQDVWVLPGFFHGTTLRVFDPALDAWHILWSDPLKAYFNRQIGRAEGADIVQIGQNDAGEPTRWRFIDITPDSFCWLGEKSLDSGTTWTLEARFLARRVREPATRPMLDHISLGVRDLARAKRFYDAVLGALGFGCHYEDAASLGYGRDEPVLWLLQTANPVAADTRSGLHVSFSAPNRDAVAAFHAAALAHGGQDNGQPGARPDYGAHYYAAFVIDPDGYRIEAHFEDN